MSYSASDLSTAQAVLLSNFASAELRDVDNATFKAYLRNSMIMVPSHDELRTREDRAIDAYFVNRSSRALGTTRDHNHTGTTGSSGVLSPTWSTHSDLFAISLKQADANVFSHDKMLETELTNVFLNFNVALEGLAVDHAFANRSQVSVVTAEATWNGLQFAYEVDEASKGQRFAQIINSTMKINKYTGAMTYFCDTTAFNKFQYQNAQGISNATNLSFQFQGNTYIHSVGLESKVGALGVPYIKGSVIAVADGTIAALPWIPKQNVMGVKTMVNDYGTIINPADDIDYGVHIYEERADGTATGGYTQDVIQEFQISLDVSFDNAPLSVANETTLFLFALV